MPTNTAPTTTHVITINSKDRVAFPAIAAIPANPAAIPPTPAIPAVPARPGVPYDYQVVIPQRYRNIWSAQLLNIAIVVNAPLPAPLQFVYLRIDKFNNIDSTSPSGGVDFCFAKIPLSYPIGGAFYADALSILMPAIQFQNPIASLESLKISITDADGNILQNVGEHTMQIQLQCGDYVNNGGGSTLTRHGRILGGTH